MAPKAKKSASAIHAYKGFAAQPTRMALLLLQSTRGAKVSMEYLDDVGVQNADRTQLASQMKVGKVNPVTNRAEPLWKTFANWVRQIRRGEIDPSLTTFELHVPKSFPGAMVRSFSEAQTKKSVGEVFEEARKLHWGESPKFPKRAQVSKSLRPHIDELFASQVGSRAFQSVIERFKFTIADKSAVEELHVHIRDAIGVTEGAVEKVLCYFHGWVSTTTQEQIEKTGEPPVISWETAHEEFHRFRRSITEGGVLPDLAVEPAPEDYSLLLKYQFIRQLELVNAEFETQRRAITMFFKAGSARTKWIEHDHIREDSIEELYETLLQAYRDNRVLCEITPNLSAEQQGQKLLTHCHMFECLVEQKQPPNYFISGCFHVLADALKLGWHPNYRKLLENVA